MTGTLVHYKDAHQYLRLKGIDTKFLGYLSTMYYPSKDEAVRQRIPEKPIIKQATEFVKTASCVVSHTLLQRNS